MAINSLLNIGSSALMANQTAINVTGNNIANVNTDGYSRQTVRFEELQPLNFRPGQLGQGVESAEILRHFNRFVENNYLDKFSEYSRWGEQKTVMQTVENLFNETNRSGISSALGNFFNDWQNLSLRPNDAASREALLARTGTMVGMLNSTRQNVQRMQQEMDQYINQGVREVNELLTSIQDINKQISREYVPGVTNVNSLLDDRDRKVRELAEYIDITVEDRGPTDFTIRTVGGLPLVEGNVTYSLQTGAPQVENFLKENSKYTGTMNVVGTDSHEYTYDVLSAPQAGPPPVAGSMRVSIDGGKSWLRDDTGAELHLAIPDTPNATIKVKNLEVSFTGDPTQLSAGDRFTSVPKEGLYWISPTRGPLNITPQVMSDGSDNGGRVNSGKLAAYYDTRDNKLGRYGDRLDALANTLIWEVNSIHSQGAGLTPMKHALGAYQVKDPTLPLGSDQSGLAFNQRLNGGNIAFQVYDRNGKPIAGMPEALDFDTATAGIQNFDPSKHSLEDVAAAINRSYDGTMTDDLGNPVGIHANIVDGKLQLTSVGDSSFATASDSAGILASLGINTYFKGSSASDIALTDAVVQNPDFINAGKVNANGEINMGDNSTALEMTKLSTKQVDFSTFWEHSSQTIGGYYGSLVGLVGAETRTVNVNASYTKALSDDLKERSLAISGVNLDEEMTSLIKFQHSYTAAAKLITTADQMIQTLLGLKQ